MLRLYKRGDGGKTKRRYEMKGLLKGLTLALICLTILFSGAGLSWAATTNYPDVITGIQIVPVTFSRTLTATETPVTFKLPFKAQVLGVSAHVKTIDLTDTNETYTVDVKEAGTSVLSSAISIAAANTVYEGTVSDSYIADEATVTVVVTLGGTTPSLTDLTVLLTIRRTN